MFSGFVWSFFCFPLQRRLRPRASFHSKAALFCVLGWKGERYDLHTEKVQILSFEDCIEAGLEGSILPTETEKSPDAIAEGKDMIQRLRCAIDCLTNEERAFILAHFFFHTTQEELARRHGITQAAVSQRLQRILQKLREELEKR